MSLPSKRAGTAAALFAATLFAVTLAAPAAFAASDAGGDVSAIINGQKIYKKDVMSAIKEMEAQAQPGAETPDPKAIYPMVISQIVNEKLVEDAAKAAKITESQEYKQREGLMKAQLLKSMYIEKALKNKISDDAVKAAYNQFKNENKGKMEVHARHILVPSEVEAKQVIKDLSGGAKFDDLARRRSSGPAAKAGGDLGWFLKDEVIPEISNAAFELKPGTYSKEPVKTDLGWHVIMVEDKRERVVPEFKAVAGAIRDQLARRALDKLLGDLRNKAEITVYDLDGKKLTTAKEAAAAPDAPKAAAAKTGNAAQAQEAKEAEKAADKK